MYSLRYISLYGEHLVHLSFLTGLLRCSCMCTDANVTFSECKCHYASCENLATSTIVAMNVNSSDYLFSLKRCVLCNNSDFFICILLSHLFVY
jgi:hypothetical protein